MQCTIAYYCGPPLSMVVRRAGRKPDGLFGHLSVGTSQ